MNVSWTFSRYVARYFIISIMIALFGVLFISLLIDTIELLRRATGREAVPFSAIIAMSWLRLPYTATRMMPYSVLIGSMLALTRLTRTHELVVARAAGVSVWQFLLPAIAVVLMLGCFTTAALNPISSALLLRYEHMESKYLSNRASMLSILPSGLWLRQVESGNNNISEHIIYASRLSQGDMSFSQIIIFTFDNNYKFTERLDADHAQLEGGQLHLTNAIRSLPGQPPEAVGNVDLTTTLTLNYIQDSFASPETMSFWALPSFITILENAGFSAIRHRLYWHSLLSMPFLMAGMVWIAAVFSLRLPRRGKIGMLAVAGIVTGFMLYFFTDIVHAFGAAGTLPIWLAAWTPALVVSMLGAALLLQLEDG